MKINTYKVLTDAIHAGIEYGYHRAYKYTDNPDKETFTNEIHNAILNEISEYFLFDEILDN
jgi:hypothetical protein